MRKLLILLALVWLIFWVTYADSSSSGEESTPPRYIAFFDDGQDDEDWDEDEEDWDEDEEHEDDESFDDAQEDWDWEDEDSDEEDDEFEDEFDGEDYSFDDAHDEEDDYEFDLEVEKEELPEWIEELRDEDLSEEQLAALDVIAAQIDSVDNEDQFFDLIDELIEIEEEVFGFEDIYEDDWEDFEVDEEFIAEVVKEYEDIAGSLGLISEPRLLDLPRLKERTMTSWMRSLSFLMKRSEKTMWMSRSTTPTCGSQSWMRSLLRKSSQQS